MDQPTEIVWVRKDFKGLTEKLAKIADEAVRKTAFYIQKKAQESVTDQDIIDTGALRRSIYVQFAGHDERETAVMAAKSAGQSVGAHSHHSHEVDEAIENDKIVTKGEAKIGVAVNYGYFVEFGTSRVPGRPFLRPAAADANDKLMEFFKQGLK